MTTKIRKSPRTERDGRPIPFQVAREMAALAQAARQLDSWACLPATAGNFSVRGASDSVWVSRSGIHKRNLQPTDFVAVTPSGQPRLPLCGKTSDETLVHLALYDWVPAARAILHAHPTELEKLPPPPHPTPAGAPVNPLTLTLLPHELLKALGAHDHNTPLFTSALPNTQDMQAVAAAVRSLGPRSPTLFPLKGCAAFVLLHHGIYVTGSSARQALWSFEALRFLLKNGLIVFS
jgi:methylthioribulose-1-phosphate dehydratase